MAAKGVYWGMLLGGEDLLAVVKDTYQEEKEKETRRLWEEGRPGRAEKAKRARQRYLLEIKK